MGINSECCWLFYLTPNFLARVISAQKKQEPLLSSLIALAISSDVVQGAGVSLASRSIFTVATGSLQTV